MDDRAVLADVQHVAQFPDFAAASYASVALPAAGPGELVLSVESFALSGNNLSYAATGGALGGCAYTHTHTHARACTHTHARAHARATQAAVQDYPPARGQGWRVDARCAARVAQTASCSRSERRRRLPGQRAVPISGECPFGASAQCAQSGRDWRTALGTGSASTGAFPAQSKPPFSLSLSPSLPLPPSLPLFSPILSLPPSLCASPSHRLCPPQLVTL
eukprot:COSAG03_NODE_3070_length_2249_cov_3.255814_2_plen_220_part_00